MTHGNNISSGNPGTNSGVIEDYNIVPQDSDNRKTWYASSDLYTNLASTRETGGDFNAFDFFLFRNRVHFSTEPGKKLVAS